MKAIIFSRVSTDKQNLDSQTIELYRVAHSLGYSDKNIILIEKKESGISLKEDDRKGIEELKEAIASDKKIDCFIIWELSRLGRRADVIYSIRDFFIEHHIRWIVYTPYMEIIKSDGTLGETENLMLGIFTSFVENEMKVKKERMRRGKEYIRKGGGYIGGKVLRGYKIVDGKYEINEREIGLIHKIYELYLTGDYSTRAIARELQEQGEFSGLEFWSARDAVRRILTNECYCGRRVGYPAIVDEDTFDRCAAIRKSHREEAKTVNKYGMICKGLLFDLRGHVLLHGRAQYKTHRDYGSTTSILAKLIDPFIERWVQDKVNETILNKETKRTQMEYSVQTLTRKVATCYKEIDKVKEKIERLEERYIEGKISRNKADMLRSKYNDDIKEIKKKMNEFNRRIKEETENYSNLSGIELNKLEIDDKMAYAKLVLSKIVVHKDRPLARKVYLDLYCKIDGKVYKYVMNSNTGECKEII